MQFLIQGDRGIWVEYLQLALTRAGYPTRIDGIFGEQTEASVRKFQEIFNLQADGIVGQATWYKLVRLYNEMLSGCGVSVRGGRMGDGYAGVRVDPEQLTYALRKVHELMFE